MKYLTLITLLSLILTIQLSFAQAPNILWSRTYGGSYGGPVVETYDHNYVVISSKDGDVRLLKINSMGDLIWEKTYGGPNDDGGSYVQQTSDNGFIIVGTTVSYGAGQEDVWLIKTNEYGDFVIATSDSYYIIGGGSNSFCASGCDTWLIKTDTNGDTLWTKRYHDPYDNYATCGLEMDDGYIFGTGDSRLGGCLIKTDVSGELQWTRLVIWPQESENININWIIKTYDGHLLLAYNSYYHYYDFSGNIALINDEGSVIWHKELCYLPSNWCYIYSVMQTSDSCYVATGAYDNEFFIAKVAPLVTGLNQSDGIITQSFSLLQNYPNPFNPRTTIEFDLSKSSEVTLKVFNALGEEVAILVSDRLSAGSYSYEWNANNHASGVYLYQLQAGDFIQTRKMVLVR